MKSVLAVVGSVVAALLGVGVLAQAPQAEIDAHLAAARAAAGMDYRNTFLNLCVPGGGGPGGVRGAAGRGGTAQTTQNPTTYAPPFKIFDNFYWLGTRAHSSWALQTSAGIIVIDTNFAWATEPEIIGGLMTLGLKPADIKYVVISHAHGDHDQGAAELQKRFGAKVVMGTADWDATLQRPATAPGGVPTKDISVGPEGYQLALGDTTINVVSTPGHTPGTLSYVFPVRHEGKPLMVVYPAER